MFYKKERRLTLGFLEELYAQELVKDEITEKNSLIADLIGQLTKKTKNNPELHELVFKLESEIYEFRYIIQDKYFDYGRAFDSNVENKCLFEKGEEE